MKHITDTLREQSEITIELLNMLMRMMTSKKKKETYYINKISEKIQKIIRKREEVVRQELKRILKESYYQEYGWSDLEIDLEALIDKLKPSHEDTDHIADISKKVDEDKDK